MLFGPYNRILRQICIKTAIICCSGKATRSNITLSATDEEGVIPTGHRQFKQLTLPGSGGFSSTYYLRWSNSNKYFEISTTNSK